MLDTLIDHLRARHPLQTIFLYGSRAQGTHRPDSDFDLLLVCESASTAPSSGEQRDVHDFGGILVDAWVHAPESLDPETDAGLLRLQSSVLLFDRDGFGARLLDRVNEVAARGPPAMSDGDRGAYRVWLPKMIARLQGPDPLVAGHYRAELLNALLPTWFQARREWYRGTRAASSWLRQHAPDVASTFEAALAPGAPVAALEAAVALILDAIDQP
ncbi:MAG: nucleotidyltransferase domain-containing protein [Myxococcales bacterium]|nr:nucleotidyltransferase domain-containing protein [Myxococcales bacterium]